MIFKELRASKCIVNLMPILSFQSVLKIIQTVLNILSVAISAITGTVPEKDEPEVEL